MSTTYKSTLIYGLHEDDINENSLTWDKLAKKLGLEYYYNGQSYIGVSIMEATEDTDNDPEEFESFIIKLNRAEKLFDQKMKQTGQLILIINSY